ncbi:MAG: DUF3488 and transglutaminase-like domain-containing protein [Candidatus Sumerlaeia bacterium]|nr:DUF3488 and transglutaminase-like domain-containing protein [Candidatus Sumerlaeia bacterium]
MRFRDAFRTLTYLTTFWAYAILASTQVVNPVATFVFALGGGFALMRHRIGLGESRTLWRVLNVGAIVGAIYGFFVAAQRIDTVVYLFLYLAMNRLWTAKTNRDFLQLYALGFFMVLAASVSTESIAFAPMVLAYVGLMVAALVCFTIKRDSEAVFAAAPAAPGDARAPRRVTDFDRERLARLHDSRFGTRARAAAALAGMLFVSAIAASVFFVVPRMEVGSLFRGFGPGQPNTRMSGFSDTVELGAVGGIQQDATIVGRIQQVAPAGSEWGSRVVFRAAEGGEVFAPAEETTRDSLRLRGATLELWNGRRWDRSPVVQTMNEKPAPGVGGHEQGDDRLARGEVEHFHIVIEPIGTKALFLPDRLRRVLLDSKQTLEIDPFSRTVRFARIPNGLSGYVAEATREVMGSRLTPADAPEGPGSALPETYEAAAMRLVSERLPRAFSIAPGGDAPVRSPSDGLPPAVASELLQLPPGRDSEVLSRVAREWLGDITDPLETAKAIERRLQREFAYDLDTSSFSNEPDHIERFLLSERRGHCEYFATSMVLMLRTRGIPSRLVTGFITDEWSGTGGGYFIIRQEHAHSWAEAYLADYGWVAFDPTPADGIGSGRIRDTFYRALSRSLDGLRVAWYRYVVDFDVRDQQKLFSSLFGGGNVRRGAHWLIQADGQLSRLLRSAANGDRRPLGLAILGVALMVVGILLLARLARLMRLARAESGGAARSREIREYLALLAFLDRLRPRPPGETPRETAAHWAPRIPGAEALVPLTESYYAARFADAPWDAGHAKAAKTLLDTFRRWQAEQKAAKR